MIRSINIDNLKDRDFSSISEIMKRVYSRTPTGDDIQMGLLYSAYSNNLSVFDKIFLMYENVDLTFLDNILLKISVIRANKQIFGLILSKYADKSIINFNNLIDLAISTPFSNKDMINTIIEKGEGYINLSKTELKSIVRESGLDEIRSAVRVYKGVADQKQIDFYSLEICIETNRNQLAEMLIQEVEPKYFENIIVHAAKVGNIEFLKFVDTQQRISDRVLDHACTIAATRGQVDTTIYLTNKASDPEYLQSSVLETVAGIKGNDKMLLSLLADKADIHYKDDIALYQACEHGLLDNVKILLQHCGNVASCNNRCIKAAARNDYIDIIHTLVDNGADIHDNNDEALRTATRYGNHLAMRTLLSLGANPNACKDECLIMAIEKNDSKALNILVDCKTKYTNIQVILMNCIKTNNMNIFDKLVSYGKIDKVGIEQKIVEAGNMYKSIFKTISEYSDK